jgi:hypothetical protein
LQQEIVGSLSLQPIVIGSPFATGCELLACNKLQGPGAGSMASRGFSVPNLPGVEWVASLEPFLFIPRLLGVV